METSDDEGESASLTLSKALFVLLIFLPACHKPQKSAFIDLPKDTVLTPPQKASQLVKHKKLKKKKLYITFDDGPNKGTKNVLHIVKDEAVPVTFFLVGEHVFASKAQAQLWDSLQAMQDVDICNHSYSHANNRYASYYEHPDSVIKDFDRTADSLHLTNNIVRTPGRNIWRIDSLSFTDIKKSTAAADSLQKAGYTIMGWDLEWHYDPKTMSVTTTAQAMVDEIDSVFKHNRTKQADHLVLLAHDQVYGKTDDSIQLRQFLQLVKNKDDYELAVATSYPGAVSDSIKLLKKVQ